MLGGLPVGRSSEKPVRVHVCERQGPSVVVGRVHARILLHDELDQLVRIRRAGKHCMQCPHHGFFRGCGVQLVTQQRKCDWVDNNEPGRVVIGRTGNEIVVSTCTATSKWTHDKFDFV